MTKQAQALRELSNKKLLNSEQRKTLYKIFCQRLEDIGKNLDRTYEKEKEILRSKAEREAKKNPEFIRLRAIILKGEYASKKLSDLGFDRDLELHHWASPKEVDALRSKHTKEMDKISELKTKLLGDIYGLPMTYEEIVSYLEKEIAKIC